MANAPSGNHRLPCLGVIPHFADASTLPAEDAVAFDGRKTCVTSSTSAHRRSAPAPHCQFRRSRPRCASNPAFPSDFVDLGEPIPGDTDLVIIPGSKSTMADLAAAPGHGWDIDLQAHVRRGGRVLGLCGGYQMLGKPSTTPKASKAPQAASKVWACSTSKPSCRRQDPHPRSPAPTWPPARPSAATRCTSVAPRARPPPPLSFRFADGSLDGAASPDSRVSGAYIHGPFSDDAQRARWLERISAAPSQLDYTVRRRSHPRRPRRPPRSPRRLRSPARARAYTCALMGLQTMKEPFKTVKSLTVADLKAVPVWQYANHDAVGETVVRPVTKMPVKDLTAKLIGTRVQLANGTQVWALIGNINAPNPRFTEQFLTLSIEHAGQWFSLARYHDPNYTDSGPEALSLFLGLPVDAIFPISFDVLQYAEGDPMALRRDIRKEPRERLTRAEIIALAVP